MGVAVGGGCTGAVHPLVDCAEAEAVEIDLLDEVAGGLIEQTVVVGVVVSVGAGAVVDWVALACIAQSHHLVVHSEVAVDLIDSIE